MKEWKWKDYLLVARQHEQSFASRLVRDHGGIATSTSRAADIQAHIDIWWTTNSGKTVGFDHKSMKKNNQADDIVSPELTWIETRGVKGEPGWLYGKADYIAFDHPDGTHIVRRTDLVARMETRVSGDLTHDHPYQYWLPYQRRGRKDIVVKVPFTEIQTLTRKIIPF